MSHLRHGIDYVIGVDGEPVYAWDVLVDEDDTLYDYLDDGTNDLTIDSWNPDLWTYDSVVAALILVFADDTQPTEVPF